MAILGVLTWLYCLAAVKPITFASRKSLRFLAFLALFALIGQLALGGWTSANYAGIVCADFPTCQGKWWPPMDWQLAFNFSGVGIFNSPGIPLENTPRVTIQMAHRLGALIVSIVVILLGALLLNSKTAKLQRIAWLMLSLLGLQIVLGISNVFYGLPLYVSLLHNLIAALLLSTLIYIAFILHLPRKKHG